jgi:DNA-binding MarR family transcriptional regulator
MTRQQELRTGAALTVFRLNGQFLALAEALSRPVGLTAARWQVLGAVLRGPLSVAGIARAMGITRQSVQRIADVLVADGLAEYLPNPSHQRAKLVPPTETGVAAVRRIGPAHAAFAKQLAAELGTDELEDAVTTLSRLSQTLDQLRPASVHRRASRPASFDR